MEKSFNRIIDFKFDCQQINDLAERLKQEIKSNNFENHVFIRGKVIRNQLLKLPYDTSDFEVVVDLPQGGITLPTLLACKDHAFIKDKNPCYDNVNGSSIFTFQGDKKLADFPVKFTQTKIEYKHNQSTSNLVNYTNIEDDAMVYGISIDSIYYNVSDGALYDFTGTSFDDLKDKTIRIIDVKYALKDDPSKILYILRTANELGFGIEKNTWVSMIENAPNIADLKVNKIREELDKILLADKPSEIIKKMFYCNCLDYTWPHLLMAMELVNTPFRQTDSIYEHTLKVLDRVPCDLKLRLAALFHDIGKLKCNDKTYLFHELLSVEMTETMLNTLQYPFEIVDSVCNIIEHHEDLSNFGTRETPSIRFIRRLRGKLGDDFEATLELIDANNKSQVIGKKINQVKMVRAEGERIDAKDAKSEKNRQENNKPSTLPINGNDIQKEFGIKKGPIIGNLLAKVSREFKTNPDLTKEECLSICRETIQLIS